MSDEKQIILKVNPEKYKEIKNYIHNDLKITKTEINEIVEKMVLKLLESQMNTALDGKIDGIIKKYVKYYLSDQYNGYSREALEKRISDAMNKVFEKYLQEKVLELNVSTKFPLKSKIVADSKIPSVVMWIEDVTGFG